MKSSHFTAYLLVLCVSLYLVYRLLCNPLPPYDDVPEDDGEGYVDLPLADGTMPPPSSSSTPPPSSAAGTPPPPPLQDVLDFSDITVTDAQRKEWSERQQNASQMQSVNDRYDAAKRKTDEHKLKKGVMSSARRRRLVESLVRRGNCGHRTRSWRTAFSDTLRGDVIPKSQSSWSVMRIGRSDPAVDLHPGALGPLSGRSGQWVSDSNIPENAFDDLDESNGVV